MQGGAIRKARKKILKKHEKVPTRKFWDAHHKYLSQKLTGRGGKLDSAFCRNKMYGLMSKYHPALFQSYLAGKVRDIPHDKQFDLDLPQMPSRPDTRPHVVDYGGSMTSLSHSENGYLQAHSSEFHSHRELI